MKRTLVRYKTRPEKADDNQRLIEKVFEELRAKSPAGLRYLALRLADGSFVHFVTNDGGEGGSSLAELEAFRAFQGGIKERCDEPPLACGASIIGNYRMLAE